MVWEQSKFSWNYYAVSDSGAVIRIKRSPGAVVGRILKPEINKKGYLQLVLSINGVQRMVEVHRLVADTFLGTCPPAHEVHHKDKNKLNNAPENLEYLNRKEHKRKDRLKI